MNDINYELQLVGQQAVDEQIDIVYEAYIDEILSNDQLMMYASNSYDCDCYFYGVK
jgi:hypothetical protein